MQFRDLSILAFVAGAAAQTWTTCNPMEKTCPSDAGLASSSYTVDFTKGASDDWKITAGSLEYDPSLGAVFSLGKKGDSPTIESKWYIFFGSVSFYMRSAPGTGIVSSAILQSDDLDEVDWEWLGGFPGDVQTNYFGKGNTTSYDRGGHSAVADGQGTFHKYTIEWTEATTKWLIDDVLVRTLNYADAVGGANYPQTPMNIRVGIWAGGDSGNSQGTIDWAGGETNYGAGPYKMYLQKIEVQNYNPGSSYTYGDKSGSYSSIKIDGASGNTKGDESAETTSAAASSAAASSTVVSSAVSTSAAPATSTIVSTKTSQPASSKTTESSTKHTSVTAPTTLTMVPYPTVSASNSTASHAPTRIITSVIGSNSTAAPIPSQTHAASSATRLGAGASMLAAVAAFLLL
ncbi:concanavalin A-like lectin/glucanase domain-containing protein [Plectosphaerella plurivora]|uniref:Crh-like protein n=1 Tax=Plectosphaerella plurivora TaxID=936078 RepID=A0A9P8VJ52_9PEZI|nr:concanavalin A-like lectin/glucanase domain-containing protein [Plectosphaerella plurivora]